MGGWPNNNKLCGFVVTILFAAAPRCSGDQQQQQHDFAATVDEMPQRPMTLKNGYHPGLFPFNKGEPFVMDPSSGSIDFNTGRPASNPIQQRSEDYYDYDAKLEEVPYDYKGDPIDRKDVVSPNAPRPNDIKPPGGNNKKQTDIYQFLNLPVKYSSSDKFPLMSSSYANTKIQGSGPTSSSLSNHKMSSAPVLTTVAPPHPSWYNYATVKTTSQKPTTTTTAALPSTTTTTTTAAPTTTTTTTTSAPSPQEYEEESVYDYADYYHPQEPPAPVSSSEPPRPPPSTSTADPTTTTGTTTTSTTTTAATTVNPSTAPSTTTSTAAAATPAITSTSAERYYDSAAHSTVTPEPSAAGTTTAATRVTTAADTVSSKTTGTTDRPEIDSKLDGTSFADYDAPIRSTEKEHSQQQYNGPNNFKPMPGNYQFDGEKTYPLITNSKVPMTFTAHVSSGISLNQREHSSPVLKPPTPPALLSEPVYSSRPLTQQPEMQDANRPQQEPNKYELNTRLQTTTNGRPVDAAVSPSELSSTHYNNNNRPKPSLKPNSGNDQYETVYYKVRPDSYGQQIPPSTMANRPSANQPPLIQSRPPYQPEPVMKTTSQADMVRKPSVNTDQLPQMSQGRPQPYMVQTELQYTKNKHQYAGQPQHIPPQGQPQYVVSSKPQQYGAGPQDQTPQYVPPQSQPDTSKFKPPKHVINHFIKTQPNEDVKSYALQTSFSIGMDGERTADTRPAQGIGQVLMVEDGSSEISVNQTVPAKFKPPMTTTSIPLVPPPRPVQKPLPYNPRPQWDNIPKSPSYYPAQPPPKRDNIPPPPPPQRQNLPNILPQFRPNAKVDTPPQSHSATIERVQIPMDHLRPPPLPKPQFLKVDRNDENIDEDILDTSEKESRIVQRPAGPQQPAKVTTLQMIQQASPVNKDNPVHVVYAANAPPKPSIDRLIDDSVILDIDDRSDVPILKTKTPVSKPIKSDFPYQIVKPDDNQNTSLLEYKAYSPTKPDLIKPNNDQELVPNLQDYVPVVTRDSVSTVVMSQKPITATLKTSEDNHKNTVDEGHKPLLQNFQIPFQPSMKLPENSNGWSVVRKSQIDNTSERTDEAGDLIASTEKFDPDNFKPQLVGGFMPINSPLEEEEGESKEKKTLEQPERAKKSIQYY